MLESAVSMDELDEYAAMGECCVGRSGIVGLDTVFRDIAVDRSKRLYRTK
jgi:hypothetical protein